MSNKLRPTAWERVMGWDIILPPLAIDEAATILSQFVRCHHNTLAHEDPPPDVAYERIRHSYGSGSLTDNYTYHASNRGLICLSGDRQRCTFFSYREIADLCFGNENARAQQLALAL